MQQSEDLYLSLLTAGKDAFEQHLFLVAYHALSAALHCAVALKDARRITEVELLAYSHYERVQRQFGRASNFDEPYEVGRYQSLVQIAAGHRFLAEEAASSASL